MRHVRRGAPVTRPSPARDGIAPALATRFVSTPNLDTVLRRGLRVRTRCSEACSLRVELMVAPATVAGLTLASPTVVVGKGRGQLPAAGSRVVQVRLSARSRRLLKRVRPHLLTLRVRATDPAGNRTTVLRPLRLLR